MSEDFFVAKNLKKHWHSENYDLEIKFSLTVKKGEMVVLLGPSGCGKSTVLKMIAGLLPFDNTDKDTLLELEGQDLLPVPAGKRQIGMVFQSPSLFPHLRTDDNIAYGLRCRGMGKKESREKASVFLERFGLAGFEKRRPESLSGGEAQRVSLARTLIIQPKLVLFDEPLSALDAPLRKRLAEDICTMQDSLGFAGIFVTHDREEARLVADRIVTMEKGHVIEEISL